jgi:hypothetical protein
MEGKLEKLARFIFRSPPKEPYFYRIGWEDVVKGSETPYVIIFMVLVEILKLGISLLLSPSEEQIDLNNLSMKDAILLDRYFHSIGFELYFLRISDEGDEIGKWMTLEQSKKRLFPTLQINTENSKFKITFDILHMKSRL